MKGLVRKEEGEREENRDEEVRAENKEKKEEES